MCKVFSQYIIIHNMTCSDETNCYVFFAITPNTVLQVNAPLLSTILDTQWECLRWMLFDQCCSYLRICRFLRGKYTTTFKKKQVATVTGQWQTNTAVEQEESASVRPRWRWWWGRRREEISEARLAQFHWFMQRLEWRVASRDAKRKTTEIRTEDVDELLDDTSSFKWGWCNSHSIQRNFGRGYYDQMIKDVLEFEKRSIQESNCLKSIWLNQQGKW